MQVTNFSCGYPSGFCIQDINFSCSRGDFVGLLGANGSGKTTLLRGLCGELPLRGGSLSLAHQSISDLDRRERAKCIAVVTQIIEPLQLTVFDYVLMGRFPYLSKWQLWESRKDRLMAEKYMEATGVLHLKKCCFSELSGGEQQLVDIAKALMQEPNLLLLDEPTSHLDIQHQIQILSLIRSLKRELRFVAVMAIHDLNLASEYCDKLLLMKGGMAYQYGSPEEVITEEHIEKTYQIGVSIQHNPISRRPIVVVQDTSSFKERE